MSKPKLITFEKSKKRYAHFLSIDCDNKLDSDLANEVGVSITTLERYRRKSGRKKKPPYKGFKSKLENIENFSNEFKSLSNKDLGVKYKVTKSCIQIWRKKNNVQSKKETNQWSRTPHPKGMSGKKHKPETIARISKKSKEMWNDEYRKKYLTDERRQKLSDNASMARNNPKNKITTYSRCKRGYRKDISDQYHFRSSWEANIARYLNFLKLKGELFKWDFEVDTFWFEKIRRGVRSYTPDFKVWDKEDSEPYYIEVKGWMDNKSKTKLNRMRIYHPNIKIKLICEPEYKIIKQTYSELLPHWE